jgi:hypothetical protein
MHQRPGDNHGEEDTEQSKCQHTAPHIPQDAEVKDESCLEKERWQEQQKDHLGVRRRNRNQRNAAQGEAKQEQCLRG